MNVAEESTAGVEEILLFLADDNDGQHFNYNMFNVSDTFAMDEHVTYYGWVADLGTTSHITN